MMDRTHLPIPSRPRTGLITYDAKDPDTSYPPIERVRPPAGAPNVLLLGISSKQLFTSARTPTAVVRGKQFVDPPLGTDIDLLLIDVAARLSRADRGNAS